MKLREFLEGKKLPIKITRNKDIFKVYAIADKYAFGIYCDSNQYADALYLDYDDDYSIYNEQPKLVKKTFYELIHSHGDQFFTSGRIYETKELALKNISTAIGISEKQLEVLE